VEKEGKWSSERARKRRRIYMAWLTFLLIVRNAGRVKQKSQMDANGAI
jgi:hypothetical protein